jgi:DNA-binding winged helix-turn-helix (wHTH) protein/pimeloyl-ACP methyl ester carboxylesterase
LTAREVTRFADCELDHAAYELRREGRVVSVEPQVFDLLVYLVGHAGRLVSKEELIEKVWNGRIVSDSALASRLKSARKAIGDDGERQQLIKTVHGRGIRFAAAVQDVASMATSPRPAPETATPQQEIRFCTASDGVRIAYAAAGDGPPIIRPANWMTHLEYDWQSPVWRHWVRDFARDRRLIRYDQRANGLSDWRVEDVSFEALVADFEAVVAAAGIERFPIVAVSQGCAVAAAYAARHPERVSRLILYGGYSRGWALRGSTSELAVREALGTLIEHGWGQDNPAFRQVFTNLFIPEASPEQVRWLNDLQRITAAPASALRLHHVFGKIDVRALLPTLRVPALVLHCRDDQVIGFEEGRLLASLIPGARFVPLEGRNHIILENEPAWPRFLGEVRAFLAEED